MHLASDKCAVIHVKADVPTGYAVINEDEFDPNKHEKLEGPLHALQADQIAAMSRPELIEACVSEVRRQIEAADDDVLRQNLRVAMRHADDTVDDDEEDAGSTHIPSDWEALHWTKRVKLAKAIQGSDAELSAEDANKIIADTLAAR